METVTSADGTTIAYDRHAGGGAGVVILIGGALSSRTFPKMAGLAETLAVRSGLTVINYDRRGRGDSGDTPGVYNVQREIDDLVALAAAVGRSPMLFGWSSGGVLALRAAAADRIAGLRRVLAFEPPFITDRNHHLPPPDLDRTLRELVAAGRRSRTVRFYMTQAMGIPAAYVALTRMLPIWPKLTATANSTPHDWAVVAEFMRGEPLRAADWKGVTVPALILSGGKTEPALRTAARAIADVLPDAEHRELPKLSHNPDIGLLAAAAAEFLTR
jgi:pimeloyl-ACP methyl ester carboxylesterase